MRKIILMTSAAVIAPMSAIAQTPTCTATPDCASLGYTQSSCPDNNGVRCPWGDAWFCTKTCSEMGFNYTCSGTGYSGGAGEACEGKYTSCTCSSPYAWNGTACACPSTYKYTCSGTGYAGGAGSACGGKYTSCDCAEGYVWKDGACAENKATWGQCSGYAENCALGDILFSDGTCSANTVSGKTPIAVVVYKSGNCGQALALKSLSGTYQWSTEYVDISSLTNYSSDSSASKDFASCENSAKIRAQGNSSTYPAVWAAYNYSTAGTEMGDWCLPAAGIFTSIYNNRSTINTGFSRANGTQFTSSTYAWSSSEYGSSDAWGTHFNGSDGLAWYNKYYGNEVRPVIEF